LLLDFRDFKILSHFRFGQIQAFPFISQGPPGAVFGPRAGLPSQKFDYSSHIAIFAVFTEKLPQIGHQFTNLP